MTNYEAIKQMSMPEMAAVFYLFTTPVLDCLEATEEERDKMRQTIREFLTTEVKGRESTN